MPGTLGRSQPQAEKWVAAGGGHGPAAGREQGGSWELPASPQETLAAFSAVLHDDVWAVHLDVNARAVCAPIQTEEGLSLFFLIRDSNASGKSSTGWLWLAQRHWVVKQKAWYNPYFCSFCLQSVSFRVGGWSHTVLQSAGPASLGSITWVSWHEAWLYHVSLVDSFQNRLVTVAQRHKN